MKIAIVSTMAGGPWAGSEELWAAMAQEALQAGHEVVISVPRWPEVPVKIRDLQLKGAVLQRRNYYRGPSPNFVLSRLLRRPVSWPAPRGDCSFSEVFGSRPDVFCLNQGGTYDFWQLPDFKRRLKAAKIPCLLICHANDEGPIDPAHCAESIDFFGQAFRVAFVSRGNLEAARRQNAAALDNAIVVQNPVNLREDSIVPWPANSTLQLAGIARLHLPTKGQDVLFEALGSALWRERDWQLNLFGEGPDKNYLQKLAQHFGLAERIKFRGHVADVRQIWAENHLLVMPSRIEGTPLSLIEAMLCGRAAVVTDLAGFPEWIEDGKTGWLAAAPTARALCSALERAWQVREQWHEMGIKAHQFAASKREVAPEKTLLKLVLEAAQNKAPEPQAVH